MKYLKQILLSSIISLTTAFGASALAKEIELINYYKPGGGTDAVSRNLQTELGKKGLDVTIRYTQSCADALKYLNRNPSSFIVGSSTDFNPNRQGKCVMNADTDGIKLYTSVVTAPSYFCASPGKDITVDDLFQKELKIGISKDEVLSYYFQYFLNNTVKPNNIKIVPYNGGGDVIRAALAKDIDLWFGAGPAGRLIKEGSNCFGTSLKQSSQNYPFMGVFTTKGNDFPELPVYFVLWTKDPVDPEINKQFISVLQSAEFEQAIAARFLTHTGIGKGNSGSEELEQLRLLDKILEPLRN